MSKKISEILELWEEKVELRNQYTFGDEKISLTEFSELLKNTFEIIRDAKNEFIYKSVTSSDPFEVLDYIRLLTTLSKYMTYDCTEDESEDKKFTATCLVAQKLLDYATYVNEVLIEKNGAISYFDNEDEKQGIFTFLRDDYPFFDYDDEENYNGFSYNIYDGNFEEILELALQL